MDMDKYAAAVKKIKTEKPPENYLTVQISYDTKLILPHKAGMALIAALENAEMLKEKYSEPCRIVPLEQETLISRMISAQEYQQIKIANLLNVSLEEIQKIPQLA